MIFEGTSRTWVSFLPDYVLHDLESCGPDGLLGRGHRFEAVVLFADVSGFTPMSEALGKVGRRGAEELTSVLNGYFEPTIELIHSFGGTVAKFGGDALTVVFPASGRDVCPAARRALQCALDMQAGMGRYAEIETSAGLFALTVKAGLASGRVLSVTVGDPEVQLEHALAGEVLELAAEAEHHAEAGDVVAHRDLVEPLGAGVAILEGRDAFSLIGGIAPRARRARHGRKSYESAEIADAVTHYLHASLVARIRAGQAGLVNEHRKVSVLFGSFDGFDYDSDPNAPVELQRYAQFVVKGVERYGGHLRQIDMGDKGSKFIAVFGTPISHEDDEERAVRCALDLVGGAQQAAIGVNSGLAFCGLVGGSARREYAVMGDAVNVAARLMQAAEPGQVLVGDSTRTAAKHSFHWSGLGTIALKGKAKPLAIFEPREREPGTLAGLQEPAHATPLIGRRRELRRIEAAIERARAGRGQITGIAGEAGIGKSRLVEESMVLARQRELIVYAGACQSYGAASAYLVWREIWQGLLEVDLSLAPEALVADLATRLAAIEPALGQRAPLLGPVLNVPLPDNELTATLEPQMRAESLHDLLLTLLRRRVRQTPLMLVLEDAQWIDPSSRELLEFVGRNMTELRLVILAAYRVTEGEPTPLAWASRRPGWSEIALRELAPDEARRLIDSRLRGLYGEERETPHVLADRVTAQAGGNPFYVEELLSFIAESDFDIEDSEALASLPVPDSLESLIMARIDALTEAEKSTIKVASVIGRLFRAELLWGSYPPLGLPAAVKKNLDQLSKLGLTPLDKPEPELQYFFRHATIQEVAYDSLAFATREDLHERIGLHIEGAYEAELPRHLDVLAHHFGRSRNTAKQRIYFSLAADAAKATYANESAIGYYRRLLEITPEALERSEVMLGLGEVLQLVGEWGEAEKLYREALLLAEESGQPLREARCRAAVGNLLSYTESYDDAVKWLVDAVDALDRLGEEKELGRVLESLSYTYFRQPDYERAIACARRRRRVAEMLGDSAGKSAAAEALGLVYWHRGEHERSLESFRDALRLARESDFKRGLIHANNDLAGLYAEIGELARSVACLEEAFEIASEIGYQHAAAVIIDNVGELRRELGDYERALACHGRALEIAIELGDLTGIERFTGHIGLVCAARGQRREAKRLLDRAIAAGRALNDRWLLGFYLFHRAALAADLKQQEADQLAHEALEIACEIGDRETELSARLLIVQLEATSRGTEREAAVAQLDALLKVRSDRAERAAIAFTGWLIDPGRKDFRELAADGYRTLHEAAPRAQYRLRYAELTGSSLPEPANLPVADRVTVEPVKLEALIEQATAGLDELGQTTPIVGS